MNMIATGGPAAPPASDVMPNAALWPQVLFSAWRAASRIDRTASDTQALFALREAIGRVNAQLVGWLGHQQALNPAVQTLADVPNPAHQPEGWYTERYLRAVYSAADALLAESFRDFDSSAEGDRRADAMEGRLDAYRRESQHAVADITGRPRRTIDLL